MARPERGRRIALVTPWYGRELIGGAERLAWDLSHALARTGADVEVLTTCCRSFHDDWGANYHRPGTATADGILVRRFKVDSRDRAAFSRANAALITLPRISLRGGRSPINDRDVRAFFENNIVSKALLAHLGATGRDYDAVLFVPYFYGPTVGGVPLVADRAFIVPCLHDEPYAYVGPVRDAFAAARGVLFNSSGEAEVGGRIFGPAIFAKSRVIGHAVDPVEPPRIPATFGTFAPHRSRYVLYLGRQDRTKNVDFLLEAFAVFRERRVATSLQLVLAGPRSGAPKMQDGVVDLGPVREDLKSTLLTYARALAQPSVNESFSRAVYESWYAQRPVVVHGECRATASAVEESGGGWIAHSLDDWVRALTAIDESADDAVDEIGQRGFAAAAESGSWDVVATRTLAAIDDLSGKSAEGLRVDQVVPLGERSIAQYAGEVERALRRRGADAGIVIAGAAGGRSDALSIVHAHDERPAPVPGDAIIAHAGTAFVPQAGTPAVFAATSAVLQTLTERGVAARLLPQAVDPSVWTGVRPAGEAFDDGRLTVLSIAPVGRADAERLIEVLVALIGLAGNARLIVAADDCDDDARGTFEHERHELDLHDAVAIIGPHPGERYAALRAAHVACALGQPLDGVRAALDPLWFDIPVIAFDDPIVRETIESCGLLLDTRSPLEIAALLKVAATDAALRHGMVSEGRRVRARHAPEAVAAILLESLRVSEQRKAIRAADTKPLL